MPKKVDFAKFFQIKNSHFLRPILSFSHDDSIGNPAVAEFKSLSGQQSTPTSDPRGCKIRRHIKFLDRPAVSPLVRTVGGSFYLFFTTAQTIPRVGEDSERQVL